MTRRARDLGAVIAEVPIDFDERTEGASKMSSDIVREALVKVTLWDSHVAPRAFARPCANLAVSSHRKGMP